MFGDDEPKVSGKGQSKEAAPTPVHLVPQVVDKMALYKAKPTVGRFRVLVGKHNEGGVTYGKGLPTGDVVDSKSDLEKLNTAAGKKFERIGKKRPTPAQQKAAPVAEEEENWEDDQEPDGLEDQTVEELKQVAEDEEVELPAHARKADIVAAIRDARKGKA